jgi:hypothetical protein
MFGPQIYLALVLVSFAAFAVTLAWQSWLDAKHRASAKT